MVYDKKRILAVLAALLLGIGILTSLVVFTDFMEQTIYEESTAHLTEIYHQANQTLYNKVSFNWGVMRMWTPYLERSQSDADVCPPLIRCPSSGLYCITFPVRTLPSRI